MNPTPSLGKSCVLTSICLRKATPQLLTSPRKEVNSTEQTNNDVPENLHLSPPSLLDFPADLDLELDFTSPQSEMGHHSLETRDLQSDMDLGPVQSHPQSQPFLQEPRSRIDARYEPEHQREHHGAPQGSYLQTPSTSTVLPCAQPPTTRPGHRLSLTRTVAPQNINGSSQEGANGLLDFEHRDGMVRNTNSEDTAAANCGYGQFVWSQPHSNNSGIQGSYLLQQLSNPAGDTTLLVCKLSGINVELHQHMQSILVERSLRTESSGPRGPQELAVDRTFRLSHQYTEILNDIFSQCKSRQASTGSPPAVLELDQPSLLLVLSSYLCLVELYDKILQHIKAWTEVRLTRGKSTAEEHLPVQLPTVAIGCFQLPELSSTRALVLICTIEATVTQIHDQVNEMMRPIRTTNEQGTMHGDGMSSVAKLIIQEIRTKEDATMKLLHVVWRLALQCGEKRKPDAS